MRRGEQHWGEAEQLLRVVMGFSPRHEHSRVELARLLMRRGELHWGEAEQLLRAAMGFSPRHEHSRVELARLLMRRGEQHWGEAEQLLRVVMGFSPRHEPSRLILALLLHRRGVAHHAESKYLLEAILAANPSNVPARQLMVQWFETDHEAMPVSSDWILDDTDYETFEQEDFDTAPVPASDAVIDDSYGLSDLVPQSGIPTKTPVTLAAGPSDTPAASVVLTPAAPIAPALWRSIQRIQSRSELQTAFMATLTAPGFTPDGTALPERLTNAAERGDPLAGLYVQWLAPSTTLEAPPSAWAWRACRLWQRGCAEATVWQNLLIEFPEHKSATKFVQSQVMRDDSSVQQQLGRLREQLAQENRLALSAEQALVVEWTAPGVVVDSGKVFDLLHCAAVTPPEFEGQRLAA